MPTYTEKSWGSYTISSSGMSYIGPGGGTNMGYSGPDGDENCTYVLYCSTVQFTSNGTAHVKIYDMSGGVSLQVQASNSNGTVDANTGIVTPSLGNITRGTASGGYEYFALDVTAGTYKIYVRLAQRDRQTAVIPAILFEAYPHTPWSHKVLYLGERVNTTTTRAIPTSEQSEYKLYRFYLNTDYTGTGSFVIESTEPAATKMYIATVGDETAYSHDTGDIYSEYEIQHEFSSNRMTVAADTIRRGVYFWVRHDSPTTVASISITIYPPGAIWSTYYVATHRITASGYSTTYTGGSIAQSTVNYLELTFSSVGTYQFKVEGSDRMYGYLASSFDINNNGYPASGSNIIGSDTSSQSGFSFSAAIDSTSTTYYLLFRTDDGSPNAYEFDLTITPVGEYSYTKLSAMDSISTSRDKSLNFTSTGTRYNVRYFKTTYTRSGTVTVTVGSNTLNGLVVYMVPDTDSYGYSSATGAPYTDNNHTEAVGAPSQTFDVVTGRDYYIWIRTTPPDVSGQAVATVSLAEKQWTYQQYSSMSSLEQQTETQEYPLSEKTGAVFSCSFRYAGEATFTLNGASGSLIYVTEGNYGFSTAGVPWVNASQTTPASGASSQTLSSALRSTNYYVWVSPGSLTTSFTVTVTIDPPPPPSGWELDDRTSDSSMTDLSENISSKSISLSARHTAEYVLSIVQDGTVRITSSGNIAVSIYVGVADSTISTSNGIPADYDYYDEGSNNFDVSFRGESGTTYYIWIKCNSAESSGTITIAVSVPSILVGDRGLWVFTSDLEWRKLTPYIVVQSGSSYVWTEAKGYVYTANGWGDQY